MIQEGNTAVISGNRLTAASTVYPADVTNLYTEFPDGAIGPEAQKLLNTVIKKAGGSSQSVRARQDHGGLLPRHQRLPLLDQPDQPELHGPERGRMLRGHQDGVLPAFRVDDGGPAAGGGPQNPIPTRLVEGFLPSDPVGGVGNVTNRAAHAWVEVYFPGYGWIRFDPTGGEAGAAERDRPDRASRRRPRPSGPTTVAAIRSADRHSTSATAFP